MATNNRINTVGLDFDQIRGNLKEYLRGQSRFSDFDFEGSNMSILLDVLAYNTHYNALYTNMAVNEVFLDSASKRSSVVQIARALGYTPRAYTSAKATVSFKIVGVPANPHTITIPRGTSFFTTQDDTKYKFITDSDYTVQRANDNGYYFTNVKLIEGVLTSTRFVVTPDSTFIIPSKKIDVATIKIKVNNSQSYSYYENYVNEYKFTEIDSTSNVFFLNETHDGYIEVSFGDGIFGKQLGTGNVIDVEYVISSGAAANGIKRGLIYNGANLLGGSVVDMNITTIAQGGTYGGADPESIEEIRHNAPNYYAAQNRAVTAKDYAAIITARSSVVDHCISWGGEANVPPVYGKVFICAKTVDESPLTFEEKQDIINNIINPIKTVTVIPEFIDPNYIRIVPDIVVYYDPRKTTKTRQDITTDVMSVTEQYSINELEKFNRVYRGTQLSRLIEFTDDAILSTVIRSKIHVDVEPVFDIVHRYEINIRVPVVPGTLTSDVFYSRIHTDRTTEQLYDLYLDDDGAGNVRLYRIENTLITYIDDKLGTIDYSNGIITIPKLSVYNYNTEFLSIKATPSVDDIAGINNNVISLDIEHMAVSVIADEQYGKDNSSYIYTPNRI